MNTWLWVFLLGIFPLSELKGAIFFGVQQGLDPFYVFLLSVFANIVIIPFIFIFLDTIHKNFMNIILYRKIFELYINRTTKKINKYIGSRYEFLALLVFVAIPLPGTGAYTGTLIAWLFNLNKKESFKVISAGVVIAGIITISIALGLFSLF